MDVTGDPFVFTCSGAVKYHTFRVSLSGLQEVRKGMIKLGPLPVSDGEKRKDKKDERRCKTLINCSEVQRVSPHARARKYWLPRAV